MEGTEDKRVAGSRMLQESHRTGMELQVRKGSKVGG